MPEEFTDSTDLIDVSDVSPELDEMGDFEAPLSDSGDSSAPAPSVAFGLASLGDRLSAFLIDAGIIYGFYWAAVLVYCYVELEKPPFDIPVLAESGIILHSIVLLFAFLYFFVAEAFLHGTIGKFLCGLRLRRNDGRPVGIIGSLIRNILRPLDIVLFPIAMLSMDRNAWNQRLGDLLGRTIVIKAAGRAKKHYAPSINNLASASGRLLSTIFDLVLIAGFAGGVLFLLDNERPLVSLGLLTYLPLILFFGILFLESWFRTTPGKWIFGYVICHEDGFPEGAAGAAMRTLFRPFDYNPFGLMSVMASPRRQRPGDGAAGTVVIKHRRELRGLACFLIATGFAAMLAYAGLKNTDSMLKDGEGIGFLVHYSFRSAPRHDVIQKLRVDELAYATGTPANVAKSPYFNPGETIYISFMVSGYILEGNFPWISQDLAVKYPDGSSALLLENLVEFKTPVSNQGPVRLQNNFDLPDNAPAGRYTMVITVHDKNAGKTLKRHYFFYVKASTEGIISFPPDSANEPPSNEEND